MKSKEQTTHRKLSLAVPVIALVEEVFFDTARAKPQYGAVSHLVTELLRDWLTRQEIITLADAERVRLQRARSTNV